MQTNEPLPSSSRNLVLNWDEHSATFFSRLRHLRSDLPLTDVTLSTSEGGEFRAHKLVLSVCSEYFDKIFVNNRSFSPQMTFATHSVVYLRDVTSKHVEMMLEYMYQGTVTVHEEELPGFLATANALKLRGLVHESNSNASTSDTRTRKRSNEYVSEESGLPKTVKMEEIDLEVEDVRAVVERRQDLLLVDGDRDRVLAVTVDDARQLAGVAKALGVSRAGALATVGLQVGGVV